MLWSSDVKASLYLVRVSSLEYWSNHGKSTSLSCFLEVWTVQASQAFSDGDQLVVVRHCLLIRNQETVWKVVHLSRVEFNRFKGVGDVLKILGYDWVAIITRVGWLGNSCLEDLDGFFVKFKAPVIWLIQEHLILLLKEPQFISLIRNKLVIKFLISSEERSTP